MVQINADGMTKRKSLARRVLLYAIIAFITSALIAAVLIMIGLIPLKRMAQVCRATIWHPTKQRSRYMSRAAQPLTNSNQ